MLIDDWRSMLAVRAGSVHLLHLLIGTSLVFNIFKCICEEKHISTETETIYLCYVYFKNIIIHLFIVFQREKPDVCAAQEQRMIIVFPDHIRRRRTDV